MGIKLIKEEPIREIKDVKLRVKKIDEIIIKVNHKINLVKPVKRR